MYICVCMCVYVCVYVCMCMYVCMYEVSTGVNVNSVIVRVVTLRILVNGLQYFRETVCLHLQGRHKCSENAGIMFLRNTDAYLPT